MYFYGNSTGAPVYAPDDIRQFLPDARKRHYRPGRSMAEAARFWMDSTGGLPPGVADAVGEESLIAAHFEFEQVVYGRGKSQTDVMAFTSSSVIAVEAKVDEAPGPIVADWLVDPKGNAANRMRALDRYASDLGVSTEELMPVHYQFLHRSLSAAIVARSRCATRAWMILQLFPGPLGHDVESHDRFRTFEERVGDRPTFSGQRVDLAVVHCRN